ncbi:MAG TPA: MBL fold metallo-hydrolase [Nakamurella multipartita]|nr:MBL fold metallo-hydrolase [Nakamurella multipartita]
MVTVLPVEHPGLGNSSYLVDLGDGRAAVIDPQRDVRPYLSIAHRYGLRIGYAVETHVHADFVTGSRELAAQGAQVVAAGAAGLGFGHRGLADGDRLDVGGLALEMVATPGHTPHHASWLLRDGDTPAGVFTGGALIVGGVARTDLVSPDRTEDLARAAYRSVRDRLLTLPDELPVWPTHGPGSFCSSGESGERTSTIGTERDGNPLLAGAADEDEFVRRLLGGLGSYPDYFRWLPDYNRAGPVVFDGARPGLPALDPALFRRRHNHGAQIVDVRPVADYAAAHVPGSISNELRPQFASFLGWTVDPAVPVLFVTAPDTDLDDLVSQCLNIGYEQLAGHLSGGMPRWRDAGLPTAHIEILADDMMDRATVIDVRQAAEFAAGHVPGALNLELGGLFEAAGSVPADRPVVTMCAHGQRSMTGASLLARHRGSTDRIGVFTGSTEDWAARTGHRPADGP